MSAEETCAALHLSPENQRVLLHRGRAVVRRALEVYHCS
jgi:RNA polymerase sigma-70 factor, ECF subfamily